MLSQRQAFRNRPRQGLIEICLGDHDRLLIADLAGQFRSLLSEGDDAALQRLYPTLTPITRNTMWSTASWFTTICCGGVSKP